VFHQRSESRTTVITLCTNKEGDENTSLAVKIQARIQETPAPIIGLDTGYRYWSCGFPQSFQDRITTMQQLLYYESFPIHRSPTILSFGVTCRELLMVSWNKQHGQFMYDVTPRRVLATIVAVGKQ